MIMSIRNGVLGFAAGCLLAACGSGDPDRRPAAGAVSLTAEDIALNNRGVALMGYFDYPGGHAAFSEALERQPDWADAKINLAIATLNRQTEGDEERALALAAEVLAADPDHLRAHYVSGLLKLYRGATDEAAAHFRTVLDSVGRSFRVDGLRGIFTC